jgi:hypothetical protein
MKNSSLFTHVAAAIIITGIILLIYAAVQQTYRSSANDPQLQIARDLSAAISSGKSINNQLPHDTIDLSQSLALFVEIFDKNGNPLQSTGILNGAPPKPPGGVFEYANANIEDVLTWQPQNDVRMAMVFEKINAPGEGFVAAGRSLKETEVRESNLVKMIGITWMACMAVLVVHLLVQFYYLRKATLKH